MQTWDNVIVPKEKKKISTDKPKPKNMEWSKKLPGRKVQDRGCILMWGAVKCFFFLEWLGARISFLIISYTG